MSDRDVDWLDQLCEADEKIAELESENAKLREELRWLKPQLDHAINRRFGMLCGENDKLTEENAKLRDQLRWRKWPEEKPEAGGKYLVIWFDDAKGLWLDDIKVVQCNEPLRECFFKLGYFYWRPIGPLPGGE